MSVIDWKFVETATPEEIENIKVEIFKDVQAMKSTRFIVKEEYSEIQRQIIVLTGKKHELKTALEKAGNNIAQKQADIEILETKFWQRKKGF